MTKLHKFSVDLTDEEYRTIRKLQYVWNMSKGKVIKTLISDFIKSSKKSK